MFGSEQKSFTVIELLVVIAIIGVLASIVLVSLSGTRDTAQMAKILLYSNQVYHSLGSDIVGNWTFDEGSGPTAIDSSGYNNTCTISGATYTTDTPHKAAGQGEGKYALSFDGSNDYLSCGTSPMLNLTDKGTIEVWVKITSYAASGIYPSILGKGASAGWDTDGYSIWYYSSLEQIRGNLTNNHPTQNYISFGKPSTGVWHHLVFTWDGSYLKAYVDGQKYGSSVSQTLTANPAGKTFIVGRADSGSAYFNGLIDGVRVYNFPLSAWEIQRHYVRSLETHNNLIADNGQ